MTADEIAERRRLPETERAADLPQRQIGGLQKIARQFHFFLKPVFGDGHAGPFLEKPVHMTAAQMTAVGHKCHGRFPAVHPVGDPVPDEIDPLGPGRDDGIGIGLKQFRKVLPEQMKQKSFSSGPAMER